MTVRIGKIDLVGLSRISTEDTRQLVKQRGPGQAGGLFQDLGREPVTVVMEGILLGEDTQSALEDLRTAHAKATPLSFAADAIAGADLTHVLIADLHVRQLAGHTHRFGFFLRVREHTEAPEDKHAETAGVDSEAKKDAEDWQEGAVDAAEVKQNPETLMTAIDENPAVVAHLDGNELGDIVGANAETMNGQEFGQVLGTVCAENPAALATMVVSLKEKGKLASLIEKLSNAGVQVLDFLIRVNLDSVIAIIKAIAGGAEFINKLKQVLEKAKNVWDKLQDVEFNNDLTNFEAAWKNGDGTGEEKAGAAPYLDVDNPYRLRDKDGIEKWVWEVDQSVIDALAKASAQAQAQQPRTKTIISDFIQAITEFVQAVDELTKTDTVEAIIDLAKSMQLEQTVAKTLTEICAKLKDLGDWIAKLERIAAIPRLTADFFLHLEEIMRLVNIEHSGRKEELEEMGWGELVSIVPDTRSVLSFFKKIRRLSNKLTEDGAVEQSLHDLQGKMNGLQDTFKKYLTGLGIADKPDPTPTAEVPSI